MAGLRPHRSCVRLLANGGAYLVMRRFDGGNLRTILDRSAPLGADASRQIVEEVAGALAAAHRRGVTHGDLRPANILIDADGHTYLADFGLSYDLTTSARAEATMAGAVRDRRGRPSRATLYALGALVGRLATEPTDRGLATSSTGHVHRTLPSASTTPAHSSSHRAPQPATRVTRSSTRPDRIRYRGLEAFQEANAAVSSAGAIDRAAARTIGAHGPPAGSSAGRPSGSGKSASSTRTRPALRLGAVPGFERWFIANTVVPGRSRRSHRSQTRSRRLPSTRPTTFLDSSRRTASPRREADPRRRRGTGRADHRPVRGAVRAIGTGRGRGVPRRRRRRRRRSAFGRARGRDAARRLLRRPAPAPRLR